MGVRVGVGVGVRVRVGVGVGVGKGIGVWVGVGSAVGVSVGWGWLHAAPSTAISAKSPGRRCRSVAMSTPYLGLGMDNKGVPGRSNGTRPA